MNERYMLNFLAILLLCAVFLFPVCWWLIQVTPFAVTVEWPDSSALEPDMVIDQNGRLSPQFEDWARRHKARK